MSEIKEQILYEKPKIIIIDMPEFIAENIKSLGFNIVSGTFGSPFKVGMKDDFIPVPLNHSLPNISEQEVIIVDLNQPEIINNQQHHVITPYTEWYYASCHTGEIDPRPIVMDAFKECLNRLYNSGCIFIIFSAPDLHQSMYYGSKLGNKADIEITNWTFLNIFSYLGRNDDSGKEIFYSKSGDLLSIFPFLSSIKEDSFFKVSFEPYGNLEENWTPLLWNKYDKCIGGIIHEKEKGLILILPQISNKEEVVVSLLKESLPDLRPKLFPDLVSGKWLERDEYEFESIVQLKSEIARITEKANYEIDEIDKKIAQEREQWGYLHRILIGTGTQLVKDIEHTLKLIFDDIINIDEKTPEGANVQEDLQINDKNEKILVEIKGLSGFPNESDIAQLTKYIVRRADEWNSTDVRGLFIVNHERNIPPLERRNDLVFTPEQIRDANMSKITLFTSWELYSLVKGMQRWKWDRSMIQDLFYKNGRISGVPSFYKQVGTIANYFEEKKAVAIDIVNGKLVKGNTIAFRTPNGYFEQKIVSLQINSKTVNEGVAGQGIGILTDFSKDVLKEGSNVYLVERTSKDGP